MKITHTGECQSCGAYVGTHKNSKNHSSLGFSAKRELRILRSALARASSGVASLIQDSLFSGMTVAGMGESGQALRIFLQEWGQALRIAFL